MKVSIVNCAPDHNKGASAITWGLISCLKARGVQSISLISTLRKVSPQVDYRHLLQKFPEVAVFPSPLVNRRVPEDRGSKSGTIPALPYFAYVTGRTLATQLPIRIRPRDPALRELINSDLVLNRGGPFFSAAGPIPNVTLQAALWPLRYAMSERIPYAVVGESIGPLSNAWARTLIKSTLSRASFIGVREYLSRATLIEAGIAPDRINVMLDNAFWVEPRRSSRVDAILKTNQLEGHRFLAVTARESDAPNGTSLYVRKLARTIDALVSKPFERVAIISNYFHPRFPRLDDRSVSQDVFRHVAAKDRVSVIEDDLAPDELASLYGVADCVLGTRLHSIILALVGGSRVVALSYLPKTQAIMDLLGLSEYVLHMDKFDNKMAVETVHLAMRNQISTSERIFESRVRANETWDAFVRSVSGKPEDVEL